MILAFKDMHFSYNLAPKHKLATSSGAQPEKQPSWVILAEHDCSCSLWPRVSAQDKTPGLFRESPPWCPHIMFTDLPSPSAQPELLVGMVVCVFLLYPVLSLAVPVITWVGDTAGTFYKKPILRELWSHPCAV